MAMAVPLLNPCVLAKLKKPWEEGKFTLKADKHLIRMLQTVKAQFKKQLPNPGAGRKVGGGGGGQPNLGNDCILGTSGMATHP